MSGGGNAAGGGGILPNLGGALGGGGGNGTGGLLGTLLGGGSLSDAIKKGPIGQFFNNLGGQAATGVVALVDNVVEMAVDGLGAADQYTVYLRDICSANVTEGTQDLGPRICTPLSKSQHRTSLSLHLG